jgi:hypothetical protein
VFLQGRSTTKIRLEFYWYSKRKLIASNGAKGFMGPPKNMQEVFKATENKSVIIKKYKPIVIHP